MEKQSTSAFFLLRRTDFLQLVKKLYMVAMELYTELFVTIFYYVGFSILQKTYIFYNYFRHMFRRKLYALGHPNPEENYQEESKQKSLVIWLEGQFINAYK